MHEQWLLWCFDPCKVCIPLDVSGTRAYPEEARGASLREGSETVSD
jgi:hypothetical protein